MRNKDIMSTAQASVTKNIINAAVKGDAEAFKEGFLDLCRSVENEILATALANQGQNSDGFFAGNRLRVLNAEETRFYSRIIDVLKAEGDTNPLMAIADSDKALPLTVIDRTLEDMKQAHPLLNAVDTVNAKGLFITPAIKHCRRGH